MLQTLLEDRFKLKIAREAKESPGYLLVVGKDGPKLQDASDEEELTLLLKLVGGQLHRTLTGKGTLKSLADYLSFRPPFAMNPVLDATELKGIYAFNIAFDPVGGAGGAGGPRGGGGGDPESRPAFSALQDQLGKLGLRLQSAKVPDEFIVIEHAELPTEN